MSDRSEADAGEWDASRDGGTKGTNGDVSVEWVQRSRTSSQAPSFLLHRIGWLVVSRRQQVGVSRRALPIPPACSTPLQSGLNPSLPHYFDPSPQVHFLADQFRVGDPRFDSDFKLHMRATLRNRPVPTLRPFRCVEGRRRRRRRVWGRPEERHGRV